MYEFGKASELYESGHKDLAFHHMFKFIETQLRLMDYALQGGLARDIAIIEKMTSFQSEGKLDEANAFLENINVNDSAERPKNIGTIIISLQRKGFFNEGEAQLLQALRAYRNEIAHDTQHSIDSGIQDALILVTVPLVRILEEAYGKALKRAPSKPVTSI